MYYTYANAAIILHLQIETQIHHYISTNGGFQIAPPQPITMILNPTFYKRQYIHNLAF